MNVNPYLNFAGNTEEAFNYYKSIFGGEFAMLQRFKDMQGAGNVPESAANMILHVSLPIAPGYVLMGTDAPEEMGFKVNMGNNFYICIGTDSKEDADRLFAGLSAGGKVEMAMQDTFWGAYYGSCTDKFGVQWMINFQKQG